MQNNRLNSRKFCLISSPHEGTCHRRYIPFLFQESDCLIVRGQKLQSKTGQGQGQGQERPFGYMPTDSLTKLAKTNE
jgi:hypothetical protein